MKGKIEIEDDYGDVLELQINDCDPHVYLNIPEDVDLALSVDNAKDLVKYLNEFIENHSSS